VISKQAESQQKEAEREAILITVTHGYSRDHRPDLKQFILDLIVAGDGNIPLFIEAASGNQSDKKAFGNIAQNYRKKINLDTTIVGDSALYSKDNLELLKQIQWLTRVPFSIAELNLKLIQAKLKFHVIDEVQITENQEQTYQIAGVIQANNEGIEAYKNRAGRFIIATNRLDKKSFSCDEMLIKYKEQQNVERGFAFLKDPLFFADSVFLKSSRRIETMAMLMGLCLMVYSLGQREVRRQLSSAKTGIANQLDNLTNRPTLRWIFQQV